MENKKQKSLWLYPKTERKIASHLDAANCSSASEFVDKAINFYCGYLDSGSDSEYLPTVLLNAIDGLMQLAVQPINRNLFKLAVELAVAANVSAATANIPEHEIDRLRGACVEKIKRENGILTYEVAHRNQKRGKP